MPAHVDEPLVKQDQHVDRSPIRSDFDCFVAETSLQEHLPRFILHVQALKFISKLLPIYC